MIENTCTKGSDVHFFLQFSDARISFSSSSSILPPVMTQATVLPLNNALSSIIGAMAAAPEPSTTSFSRTQRRYTAYRIVASFTRSILSTHLLAISNVNAPFSIPPERPSAIVFVFTESTILPAFSDSYITGDASDCTPTNSAVDLRLFTAILTPEIKPPPPTGTTTTSTLGSASTISSPAVPCPAIINSSSRGEIKHQPSS